MQGSLSQVASPTVADSPGAPSPVWRKRLRGILRMALAVSLALCLAAKAPAAEESGIPQPPAAGQYTLKLKSGGFTREAEVRIPKNYSKDQPPPLVVVLHGAGGNGQIALRKDGWSERADAEGFIAVAPTGLPARPRVEANVATNPRVWNSGQLNPRGPRAAIDDVAFIRELLDELQQQVPYNKDRVFVAGHSNGGSMALKLAAELSERFQAVGTVAGLIAVENPQPKRPLPTLYILGAADPLMPLEGGEVHLPWQTRQNPPVREGFEKWAKSLGCETTPSTVFEDNEQKKDVYRPKGDGPTFTVLYLKGHGHQWPGAKVIRRNSGGGPVNTRLDATQTLWEFFEATK